MFLAGVAHPVERHLAKVEVASSSLVTRSIKKKQMHCICFFFMERVIDGAKLKPICMTCGRVSSTKTRLSFEELATMFEGSGAGGAEKAYRRAVEKLTRNLVDAGVLHAVELRKKRNAAAIYEYRVDYDGEWDELEY